MVLKSPEPPGLRSMPLFLLGDESCTGAAIDQDLDGQWQVTCHCAALDSLRFPTDEEAETAMDEHLDAENARARGLFDQLAAENFNDRFPCAPRRYSPRTRHRSTSPSPPAPADPPWPCPPIS
ncbi:hypothetical protein [Parafrankia sp. EUN1f]|uniref:hypothetical protein n=1 Tax=Parafrankia sp. EUN1f TaxID=102897 RepID=UPI0012FC8624|nr:hypothetical protein [Parafrankia sp. EUN1f]